MNIELNREFFISVFQVSAEEAALLEDIVQAANDRELALKLIWKAMAIRHARLAPPLAAWSCQIRPVKPTTDGHEH